MQDNEADVATSRHQEARTLNDQGLYREALEGYLWCFDHGAELQPSYGGVRVSFLLGDIFDLARVYPPAREKSRTESQSSSSKPRRQAPSYDSLVVAAAGSKQTRSSVQSSGSARAPSGPSARMVFKHQY